MIEQHRFIPRWDKHEQGYYCVVCGVLKEEHAQFTKPDLPTQAVKLSNSSLQGTEAPEIQKKKEDK